MVPDRAVDASHISGENGATPAACAEPARRGAADAPCTGL